MQELGGRSSGLSGCWGEEAPTQNHQLAAVETERTRARGGTRMLVFSRKDRERLDFSCQHKGRLSEDRQTDTLLAGNRGFPPLPLEGPMEPAQTRAQTLSFDSLFFSFFVLWAGSLASKDNFLWTPCANCAVFLWNLYTRQSRILGVQKRSLMVD